MSKLVWNETGTKTYETGVDNGVLYPIQSDAKYSKGFAWGGLTNITESPSGAEVTKNYADNTVYGSLQSAEEFSCTIEAYKYPAEFAACDGSAEIAPGIYAGQQNRTVFGLSYRTILGNDVKANSYGYKIHLVYGLLASPTQKAYASVNNSPEMQTMSWTANSTPVNIDKTVNGVALKPTSVMTFDSTRVSKAFLDKLEEILYGSDSEEARLPLPAEVIELYESTKAAG